MTASTATATATATLGGAGPGPATLAKHRLQKMIYAALETSVEQVELSRPETSLGSMVRRIVRNCSPPCGELTRVA